MQEEELGMAQMAQDMAQAAQDADILAQEAATAQGWAALDEAGGVDVLQTVFDITSASQADYADAWYDLTARIEELGLRGGPTSENIGFAISQLIGDPALDQKKREYWQIVADELDTSIDSVGVGGGGADAAIADQVAEIVYGTGADNLSESEEMLKELLEAEAAIDPTKFQEPGDFNVPGAPDPLGLIDALGNPFGSDRVMVRGKGYPPEAYRALILTDPNVEENDIRDYIERVLASGKVWDEPTNSWKQR